MFKRFQLAAALLMVMGGAVCAPAQPTSAGTPRVYREGNAWIEEISGTLPAARNIRVETQMGSVRVAGGAQSGIAYTIKKRAFYGSEEAARRELQSFTVTAVRQGDTAAFGGEWTGSGRNHRGGVDFEITAPRELDLVKIETQGGSVGVTNITGRVDATTMGGSINLDQIGGAAVANTMGGSITVGSIASEARLKTAGGSIRVETANARLYAVTSGGSLEIGNVNGPAYLETAGGSVRVRKTTGELKASTSGGNIDAGDIGGAATLSTAGGSIRLASAHGSVRAETAGGSLHLMKIQGSVHAETAAGGITAELLNGRITDSSLETTVGDVIVYLPTDIACNIRAAVETGVGGHRIRSDFPELKITSEGGDYGPKQWYANGSLNGGGPTLRIVTNIGDIEIHKAAANK